MITELLFSFYVFEPFNNTDMMLTTQQNTEILIIGSRSPFTRRGMTDKSYGEISVPDSDISFVSSRRSSTDRSFLSLYNNNNNNNSETGMSNPRLSFSSDTDGNNYSFESMHFGRRSMDISSDFSSFSQESEGLSFSASQGMVSIRH